MSTKLVQQADFGPLSLLVIFFLHVEKEAFENIGRTGENTGNQHFLLFPHCFIPIPRRIFVLNPFPNKFLTLPN